MVLKKEKKVIIKLQKHYNRKKKQLIKILKHVVNKKETNDQVNKYNTKHIVKERHNFSYKYTKANSKTKKYYMYSKSV